MDKFNKDELNTLNCALHSMITDHEKRLEDYKKDILDFEKSIPKSTNKEYDLGLLNKSRDSLKEWKDSIVKIEKLQSKISSMLYGGEE